MKDGQIRFWIDGQPPRTTQQQSKIRWANGRPTIYKPKKLTDAQDWLMNGVLPFVPEKPLDGAIELKCFWYFKGQKKGVSWKTTRPDTDNLQKGLKDIMTKAGFWLDDAQVCVEIAQKRWSNVPGLGIIVRQLTDSDLNTAFFDGFK